MVIEQNPNTAARELLDLLDTYSDEEGGFFTVECFRAIKSALEAAFAQGAEAMRKKAYLELVHLRACLPENATVAQKQARACANMVYNLPLPKMDDRP